MSVFEGGIMKFNSPIVWEKITYVAIFKVFNRTGSLLTRSAMVYKNTVSMNVMNVTLLRNINYSPYTCADVTKH